MGIETATLLAIASAAAGAYGVVQQQSAAKDAKRQAEQQQQALEAMKREPQSAMPDPDAQERARRRSISAQLGRRGRASTILTSGTTGSDALGGG